MTSKALLLVYKDITLYFAKCRCFKAAIVKLSKARSDFLRMRKGKNYKDFTIYVNKKYSGYIFLSLPLYF